MAVSINNGHGNARRKEAIQQKTILLFGNSLPTQERDVCTGCAESGRGREGGMCQTEIQFL